MFQLYKKRNFSALINDTFTFFRVSGKNYFINYLAVNGPLLLLLMVMIYLVGSVFIETFFTGLASPQSSKMIDAYFDANIDLFIGMGIGASVLIVIVSILSYSYPVLYLSLLEKHEKPTAKQLIANLKAQAGRILLFALLSLVTFLPIAVLMGIVSLFLFVIVIGIPGALILLSAFSCWMMLSFYDYLNAGTGYFKAMGNGYTMLSQNFWHYVGATAIIYIVVSVLQGILSFIPYFMGIFSMFYNTAGTEANADSLSFFGLMMLITMILSIFLTYFLGNILLINQGIIYYTARENNENKSLHSEIDLIGTDIE